VTAGERPKPLTRAEIGEKITMVGAFGLLAAPATFAYRLFDWLRVCPAGNVVGASILDEAAAQKNRYDSMSHRIEAG